MDFIDEQHRGAPGIFQPKRRLDRAMVSAAWRGAEDGDVLLLLHDCARREVDEDTARIVEELAQSGSRASLVLNKIDRLLINLQLSPDEAHLHLLKVIEQANAAISELMVSEAMREGGKVKGAAVGAGAGEQTAGGRV